MENPGDRGAPESCCCFARMLHTAKTGKGTVSVFLGIVAKGTFIVLLGVIVHGYCNVQGMISNIMCYDSSKS